MPNTDKQVDPLPNEFGSEEEAAEFWDTHSPSTCIHKYDDVLHGPMS